MPYSIIPPRAVAAVAAAALAATEELTVTAERPEKRIAPIELAPTRAGPGHYVISGATFGVGGDWDIAVVARVSDFDEYRVEVEVPIR